MGTGDGWAQSQNAGQATSPDAGAARAAGGCRDGRPLACDKNAHERNHEEGGVVQVHDATQGGLRPSRVRSFILRFTVPPGPKFRETVETVSGVNGRRGRKAV